MKSRIATYHLLLSRWARLAIGRSYWHVVQEVGTAFRPLALEGYFNDLTSKVAWRGATDSVGLPLNVRTDGTLVHFPTTIIQKGLGHWDRWSLYGAPEDRDAFDAIVDWAIANQDPAGGWPVWPPLGVDHGNPYSAMTQGEAASLLVRASLVREDVDALTPAIQALILMTRPLEKGGTARRVQSGIVLEEVPNPSSYGILNGWIFAIFGLHDVLIAEPDPELRRMLDRTLKALAAMHRSYDAGFWSYYDLQGNLASPFYHRLHMAQLAALHMVFPDAAWAAEMNARFRRYDSKRWNRMRAIGVKVGQKIARPPDTVLR